MSGTAKEAERAQELKRRAAAGDKAAAEQLKQGDNPREPDATTPHDPGGPAPS